MENKLHNGEDWAGDYNTAPVGWTEITEAEFATMNIDGYMDGFESRQLFKYNDGSPMGKFISVYLHWYSGNHGYAIERDWRNAKVNYYVFAKCEHNWKHFKNLGRSYDEYECSLCGEHKTIDSGD